MQSVWCSRAFLLLVAAIAAAGVLSGTACTRWGQPGPVMPTVQPLGSLYVSARTGSDTSGNGTSAKPYKSLTKAVTVLGSAKVLSPTGVTIYLATGDYNVANGEKFPIVIPASVTLTGSGYGSGYKTGAFVDGYGEDAAFERLVGAPARTAYATLEAVPPAAVSASGVYVGTSKITLPAQAAYAAFDVMGSLSASTSSFGAGVVSALRNVNGILVAGGSLTCTSCSIRGNDYGVGALSVPVVSPAPSPGAPSVTLSHSSSDSTVVGKVVDIITDGSVNVTVSNEVFNAGQYAFEDSFPRVVANSTRGTLDFGGGATNSSGGNILIGARTTEIAISRRKELLYALDDTWNPSQQGATRHGQYVKTVPFGSGTQGQNVTILGSATGSVVTVGPAPVPTPSPSSTPSSSPGPTATPT